VALLGLSLPLVTAPSTSPPYTLSLHDALPICHRPDRGGDRQPQRGGISQCGQRAAGSVRGLSPALLVSELAVAAGTVVARPDVYAGGADSICQSFTRR